MNDRLDTELARLRDQLQTDAARTADSAKALAALRAGEPATPRVTPRDGGCWLARDE